MSDLYQKRPMPPEPWTHEDNPDWILVQEQDGFSVLVKVEPCVHGYHDPHTVEYPHTFPQSKGICEGSPTLDSFNEVDDE